MSLCCVQGSQDEEEKSSAGEAVLDTSPEKQAEVLTLRLLHCHVAEWSLHMHTLKQKAAQR